MGAQITAMVNGTINYVGVMAVTEKVARIQAAEKSGYARETIGRVAHVIDQHTASRQHKYIFEMTNDVSLHPLYTQAMLSDVVNLESGAVNDGPILWFGPEVTVGG